MVKKKVFFYKKKFLSKNKIITLSYITTVWLSKFIFFQILGFPNLSFIEDPFYIPKLLSIYFGKLTSIYIRQYFITEK